MDCGKAYVCDVQGRFLGIAKSMPAVRADADADVPELQEQLGLRSAALADAKYRTWEWNWGASPAFGATKKRRFPYGTVEIALEAEHGRIARIAFTGDFFSTDDVAALAEGLTGARLTPDDLAPLLSDVGRFIEGASAEEIAALICE